MEKLLNGILILTLFCTGCGIEVQDKNQDGEATIQQNQASGGPILAENFKILAVGTAPHLYDLQLSWPAAQGTVVISAKEKEILRAEAKASSGTLKSLASDRQYTFSVQHYDSQMSLLSTFEKKVTTPKDIALGTVELSAATELNANRIFLLKNAVVTTGIYPLTLSANEIHADEATLQSFVAGTTAAPEQYIGSAGGDIRIVASKGDGKLQILLRGQEGINGRQNIRTDLGDCSGARGGDGGNAANLTTQIHDVSKFSMAYTIEPGKGGKAGHEMNRAANLPPIVCPNLGFGPITNGKNGQPGTVQIF